MRKYAQRFLSAPSRAPKRPGAPRQLLLEALEDRTVPAVGFTKIPLVNPNAAGPFASLSTSLLPNGNIVVASPTDTVNGVANAGGVYLYSGSNGVLITALTGSHAGDQIGSRGVTVLANGNFLVASPSWNSGMGAVTWVNGTTGLAGVVSDTNSLVGSVSSDAVGNQSPVVLKNGNVVIVNPGWRAGDGAVTWIDAAAGITGAVSSSNSIVGDPAHNIGIKADQVGLYGVVTLPNSNYVVSSPRWNQGAGAVTWGNGATGSSGVVSITNSLVGSANTDSVGASANVGGVVSLNNGNYIVMSPSWNAKAGAVTWASGAAPLTGNISATNSLIGSNVGDQLGSSPAGELDYLILSNGNCLILSQNWNNTVGAVTLINATSGTFGAVSATNSLVGSNPGDRVGDGTATALSNGHYVVSSGAWNGLSGAVTWGNGMLGVVGVVSAANSLVGNPGDGAGRVIPLTNGHYVVANSTWNNSAGAVTWGNGAGGTVGTISATNSLVGNAGDKIGDQALALANGNYVIASSYWNNRAGAVTWGNGLGGTVGTVAAANSLIGSPGDYVGADGVTLLANGNYVVASRFWNQAAGAVTWGNGAGGTTGLVSATNSLVGDPGDSIALFGASTKVTALPNGNYLFRSSNWHSFTGAVTWGNGLGGSVGKVSATNSIVGVQGAYYAMDLIVLSNSNYLIVNRTWNNGAGAVTWGHGAIGTSGPISIANSLVGVRSSNTGQARDEVGTYVVPLSNGNYVVGSPTWNNGAGAVTWADGNVGITGLVTGGNSLTGSQSNDFVGGKTGIGSFGVGVTALSNGNYLVASSYWNNKSGALTICDGTQPTTGAVSNTNSFVGSAGGNSIDVQDFGTGAFSTKSRSVTDNSGTSPLPVTYPTIFKPFSALPQFANPGVATFTLGINNSFPFKAVSSGVVSYSLSGTIPTGLSFDGATGILSGTPNSLNIGAYYLTITATAGAGNSTTQPFTLVIQSALEPSAAESYVTAVYYNLLGRPAESGGITYWAGQLNNGLARTAFISFIDHGPEYYSTIIKPAYTRFLGRQADADGLTYWTSQLSAGLRDELLEAAFIGSPEYFQHCGGTNQAWVDAMYQDLLGRLADPSGEAAWVQALTAGAPRPVVAAGFAGSLERAGQHVTGLYLKYLGRAPGDSEVNFWVGQFALGVTNEDIITGFASSDEYYQKHS